MRATESWAGERRVLVYGVTGSGKSVLAARLSALTGATLVPVDDLCWLPGWVQVEPEEQRRAMSEVCSGDAWVLDSAWGVWTDVALARAELVVALDYPRWVSFCRLLRRTATRIVNRRPVCGGNTETLRQALSSDSIVAWHVRSFRSKRERIAAWEADPAMPPVRRLRHPREADALLAEVAATVGAGS